ncbi:MAG: 3-keto-5-aminohexanoate cleavage protein [Thiolinea sp.]
MLSLPEIMVAPNGARRSKADHPQLPVTIDEIVDCAVACHTAGADGIHAHIRDAQGRHVLEAGLYRELIQELAVAVPDLVVQVTSEAAGIYQARQQQTVIRELKPAYVSVAMREMLDDPAMQTERKQAQDFYQWAVDEQVTIQHIIYSAEDVAEWFARVEAGLIPLSDNRAQLLFVLGRYRENLQSQPEDLMPFIQALQQQRGQYQIEWAVCAFGVNETRCLLEAAKYGGRLRVGFENSLWHADGSLARDNAERVAFLRRALG